MAAHYASRGGQAGLGEMGGRWKSTRHFDRTQMGTKPENTWTGIEAAIEDGADGVETTCGRQQFAAFRRSLLANRGRRDRATRARPHRRGS